MGDQKLTRFSHEVNVVRAARNVTIWVFRFTWPVVVLLCSLQRAARGADDLVTIERLTSTWQSWDESVKSLEVDGYKFIGGLRSQEHEFLFPQKELDGVVNSW